MSNKSLERMVNTTTFYSSQTMAWMFIAILMGDALNDDSRASRWCYFGVAILMSGCYSIMTILSAIAKPSAAASNGAAN